MRILSGRAWSKKQKIIHIGVVSTRWSNGLSWMGSRGWEAAPTGGVDGKSRGWEAAPTGGVDWEESRLGSRSYGGRGLGKVAGSRSYGGRGLGVAAGKPLLRGARMGRVAGSRSWEVAAGKPLLRGARMGSRGWEAAPTGGAGGRGLGKVAAGKPLLRKTGIPLLEKLRTSCYNVGRFCAK